MPMGKPFNRILLKISGEQLAGNHESGIDTDFMSRLADSIKETIETGAQVVIVVGAGNFIRGAQVAGNGIQRVTADHMGLLATVINSLALTDVFESRGVPTRCLSNI